MKQANHDHRRVDQSGGAFLNLTYAAVLAAGIAALAMIGTDSRARTRARDGIAERG